MWETNSKAQIKEKGVQDITGLKIVMHEILVHSLMENPTKSKYSYMTPGGFSNRVLNSKYIIEFSRAESNLLLSHFMWRLLKKLWNKSAAWTHYLLITIDLGLLL